MESRDDELGGPGSGSDDGPCARWCLTEFQSDSIGLEHDQPQDFVTTQWSFKPRYYVLYRLVAAAVLMLWIGGDIVYESDEFYHGQAQWWFGFATNWSLSLVGLSAIFQAVTSTMYHFKPYWIMDPIYIRAMPVILKAQWLLFNMSCNSALVVTVAYWAFIAFVSEARRSQDFTILASEMEFAEQKETQPVQTFLTSHMSRLKHTGNSIYVIADVMIGATPLRVYHVFFTVFLGSLYAVFNALYYINYGSLMVQPGVGFEGRDYYFMNWSQPVEAICTCVLAVVMTLLAQIVLHLLYLLRTWLHRRFVPQSPSGDSELQQIIGNSSSYNSLHESYGEKLAPH